MSKYVPYVRTAEGYIERISYAIFNSSDEHPPSIFMSNRLVAGPNPGCSGRMKPVQA
jgi:hypothetical protein